MVAKIGSIEPDGVISGSIRSSSTISAGISSTGTLSASVSAGGTFPRYPGPYEAVPKTTSQIFRTNGYAMDSDFQVLAIPYFEVGNEFNGDTVVIGDETWQ